MSTPARQVISRWSVPALLLLWIASGAPLVACPYSIRDSAFISGTASASYRLELVVNGDKDAAGAATKEKIAEWLSAGASAWLDDANVEARVLDLADPASRDELPSGFTPPPELPAAILVAPGGASMTLPGIAPATISLDAVMKTALQVVESPLRRGIQKRLATAWCVVLLVEGTDAAENLRARQAFELAARSITGRSTEMGKVVSEAPVLLSVSQGDPDERVLIWSLGLEGSDEENVPARAVMLVGRGERRGPQLEGEDITPERLLDMFTMLGRSCSCTTDGMWLSGPSLPLEWSDEIEALARAELGFDPRSPAALGAIRGVLDGPAPSTPPDALLGYTETLLELDVEAGLSRAELSELDLAAPAASSIDARNDPVAEAPDAADSGKPRLVDRAPSGDGSSSSPGEPTAPSRAGHGVLLALAGLALLVLVAVTVMVLRGRTA